jgi:hypothetical protein
MLNDVEQAFDESELSSEYKELYLKDELETLQPKLQLGYLVIRMMNIAIITLVLYLTNKKRLQKASELDLSWSNALSYMEYSSNR